MATQVDGPGEERVLVTGASGFIASHIVQQLQQAGYRVRGTVRSLKNETKIKHLKNLCPDAKHELELVEADLLHQECWPSAVKDCKFVLHVASPFPLENPADENELIRPAVQGTTFVLQACADAGTVKKVVVTSSTIAIFETAQPKSRAYNEGDWADQNNATISSYAKSKLLAEKCAWEFVKSLPDDKKFELATINPGYVVGPVLSGSTCTSMILIQRILTRDPPANARIQLPVVDVRDVAKAHINSMTEDAATGHRHILVNKCMWMADVAEILKSEFEQHGYSVSTRTLPRFVFSFVALFDKAAKEVKQMLNRTYEFDNTRMRQILKVTPTPAKDSLIDMAYSLIDGGFVKKHRNYKGRPASNLNPGKTQEAEKLESNSKPDLTQESDKSVSNSKETQESEKAVNNSEPAITQESENIATNSEPAKTQVSENPTSNSEPEQSQES